MRNEYIDHAYRIVLADEVLQPLGKQGGLSPRLPCDESLHDVYCYAVRLLCILTGRTFSHTLHPIADTARIVAFITEAAPVARILNHIAEPAAPPRIAPARGPHAWDDPLVDAGPDWEALAQLSAEYVLNQQVQW